MQKNNLQLIVNKSINLFKSKNKLKKIKDFYKARIVKKYQIRTLKQLLPEKLQAETKQNSIEFYKSKSLKVENLKISNSQSIMVYFYYYNFLFYLYNEIFMNDAYKFKSENKNPFIIDCGGNIGIATLYFKCLYPKSEILVFEPSSENFNLLKKNIDANSLNNITCIQKALHNKKTTMTLNGTGTVMGSFIINYDNIETEKIETDLLSNYITKEIDLLKIDIEGSECNVIEDLAINKKLKFIKQIILEYHHMPEILNKNNLSQILHLLKSNNFKCEIKDSAYFTHMTIIIIQAYNEN